MSTLSATGSLATPHTDQNDWYSFVVTGTQEEVIVDLTNESDDPLATNVVSLALYNSANEGLTTLGGEVGSATDTEPLAASLILTPGTYYAEVYGYNAPYLLQISSGLPTLGTPESDKAGHPSVVAYGEEGVAAIIANAETSANLGAITSGGTTLTGGFAPLSDEVANGVYDYAFNVGTTSRVALTLVAAGGNGILGAVYDTTGKLIDAFDADEFSIGADLQENFSSIGEVTETLSPGTYIVDLNSDPGSDYNLTLSATPVASVTTPPIVDNAGTTELSAYSLGALSAACFAEGTGIETTGGRVSVEALKSGDQVKLVDGSVAKIIWLGHRRVRCARHPNPVDVWPIRIAPHAFAANMPGRTLWLSPDHAVFIDGALIPIRYLVNGTSIVQEPRDQVTYWHVELEHHNVLLAEGLPCESYLDTGNRSAFANASVPMLLHPHFAPLSWDHACAPLRTSGAPVIAARRRLLARLPELGYCLTGEPDLRVEAAGKSFQATRGPDNWHRVTLPAGTTEVHLLSGVTIPATIDLENEDCRSLGVRIAGITANANAIALDSEALAGGFWPLEKNPNDAWRWTKGNAVLKLEHSEEPVTLELLVRDIPQRWVRRDAEPTPAEQLHMAQ